MIIQNRQREFKDYFILALFTAIILLLFVNRCGKDNAVETEPTVIYDTVYKEERIDTVYVPQLLTRYLPGKAPKAFEKWDTLYIPELTEVDTAAILEDYHSFYVYGDVITHKYGRTFINDTISRNEILGRSVTHDFLIPTITKTITLTEPKKTQLYVGGSMLGNPQELAAGFNVNLSLKTKKDKMIEVGYNQLFSGQAFYSLGFKQKISFRK